MIIAVIQARMSSTRFPGKVMKWVLEKPILEHLIERLKLSRKIDKIIVATTNDESDNQIEEVAKRQSVGIYRGKVNNVLDRFYNAVYQYKPESVIRITADCPLVDPRHCDLIIETLFEKKADFVCLGQSFAEGSDVAIFTFKALEEAYKNSIDPSEKEHVTLYIHNNPKKYKRIILENVSDDSLYRFTIDEKNDLKVVKAITTYYFKKNYKNFSYNDIITYLKDNPEIAKINSFVIRNEGYVKTLIKKNIKKRRDILFRVDGSKIIGWGHVMRCIGLAEEFKTQGYNPVFIVKDEDKQILDKIHSYKFTIEIIPRNSSFRKQTNNTVSIIKKYQSLSLIVDLSNSLMLKTPKSFNRYINGVRKEIKSIVLIDGYGPECIASKVNLSVDIVIIPYFNAKIDRLFKTKSIYLLGVDYSVIRQEFIDARKKTKQIVQSAKNILVLPGGSLNTQFLTKVINALGFIESENISIKILTKNNQALNKIQQIHAENVKIDVEENFLNIASLYNWADIAISASGLTMYEIAFVGLPAIVISHDKTHKKIANEFMKAGTIKHLGSKQTISIKKLSKTIDALINDRRTRKSMSKNGRSLVDGNGIKRIAARVIMKEML